MTRLEELRREFERLDAISAKHPSDPDDGYNKDHAELDLLRAERDAYEQGLREMVDALECEKPLVKLALHVGRVALGRVR